MRPRVRTLRGFPKSPTEVAGLAGEWILVGSSLQADARTSRPAAPESERVTRARWRVRLDIRGLRLAVIVESQPAGAPAFCSGPHAERRAKTGHRVAPAETGRHFRTIPVRRRHAAGTGHCGR